MSGGSKLAAGKLGGSISHFLSNKIQIQGVKMKNSGVQMNLEIISPIIFFLLNYNLRVVFTSLDVSTCRLTFVSVYCIH